MFCLTVSHTGAGPLMARRAGRLVLALLLAALAAWLFFHALSPAHAGFAPATGPQARLASLAATNMPSFDERRFFGPPDDQTNSVAIGDMNGDGALDLAAGNYRGQSAIYLNDGAGNFLNTDGYMRIFGPPDGTTGSIVLGDMNGDG
ncbi:MAG: VCBS repeat-containing protein, partial [Anaerolineae bacterium]|nr:VCBS repeat-containing protein [Anaerolineae bacterium]